MSLYDWLPDEVRRFNATIARFELDWKTDLNPPASPALLEDAQRRLGCRLPPSLREFYLFHDGGEIFGMRIFPVSELVDKTLEFRAFWTQLATAKRVMPCSRSSVFGIGICSFWTSAPKRSSIRCSMPIMTTDRVNGAS